MGVFPGIFQLEFRELTASGRDIFQWALQFSETLVQLFLFALVTLSHHPNAATEEPLGQSYLQE